MASGTGTPAANSTAMVAGTPTGPANVNVSQNASKGNILVAANGMTLYTFDKDTSGTSACTAACATLWPPLLTNGAPVAGTGVDGTKLATITLTDGSSMVTYNGKPLYLYSKDTKAGDTNGDGIGGVWHVATP